MPYSREFDRRWWRRKRHADRIIYAVNRLGGMCVSCKSVEALQFDHIDPLIKSNLISDITEYRLERFKAEVDKCQLLCAVCHGIKCSWYGHTGVVLTPEEIRARRNGGVSKEDEERGNFIDEDEEVF